MNHKSYILSHISYFIFLISCFLLLTSSAVQAAPPSNATDWELTFSDDFNGTSLDRSKWNTLYRYGTPIVNDEKQAYVDSALVFDPQVPGSLRIKATKNAALYNNDADSMPYSSGLITTESLFSQKYGYFEIRCRMPAGQGYWPAFWMRGAVPEEDGVG